MTCSRCINTITNVLRTHGGTVSRIDLDTRTVVAAFPTLEVQDRCFDAIRDEGYTVVPPVASRPSLSRRRRDRDAISAGLPARSMALS